MNKAVFRYVEHELYNYSSTKKELEIYKDSIINETSLPDVPTKSKLSDTTANKAIKLTTSTYITSSERIIGAIERGLKILGDNHNKLFRLKYIDCLSTREIYLEMNISERSYFRIRRELVITVAQQLGLLK